MNILESIMNGEICKMKTAFLFSGQGAQYPGMFQDLYGEQAVREVFDLADGSLGRGISRLCFEGTQEELNLTENTQPCVLAADMAAGRLLKAHGIMPDAAAGFSLGEYAALECAGVLRQEDVFPLIQMRADAMQEAVPPGEGAMAALVGVTPEEAEALCGQVQDEYVIPANYNSLVQTVISGTREGVDKVLKLAGEKGVRALPLAVSAPFHCELMKPAADKLGQRLASIPVGEAAFPVYMNYTGRKLEEAGGVREMLTRQAYSPVQWVKTLQEMQADGIDTFIECGPGRTLSGLVKKTLKDVTILRVENLKTFRDTLSQLHG